MVIFFRLLHAPMSQRAQLPSCFSLLFPSFSAEREQAEEMREGERKCFTMPSFLRER